MWQSQSTTQFENNNTQRYIKDRRSPLRRTVAVGNFVSPSKYGFKHYRPTIKRLIRVSNDTDQKTAAPSQTGVDFPGLKHVTDGRNVFYKVFWAIVILGNLFICSYQVGERFLYYLSEPVKTAVSSNPVKYLKFPAITVCPSFHQYPKLHSLKDEFIKQHPNDSKFTTACQLNEYLLLDYNYTLDQIYDAMNLKFLNPSALFLSVEPTEAPIIEDYFLTERGNCTIYKVPSKLPYYGREWNLALSTDYPFSEVKCGSKAFSTWIHDMDDEPRLKFRGTFTGSIDRGSITEVGLIAQEFNFLSTKAAPCASAEKSNKCYYNCIRNFLRRKLNCSLPYMYVPEIPPCTSMASSYQASLLFARIQQSIRYSKTDGCLCDRKCSTMMYSSSYNSMGIHYDKTITFLSISFTDNIVVTVQEEFAYSFISFLCDAGGSLGLFLGFCLVTVLEILEAFIQSIAANIRKNQ